jgi:hypothetical protein
MIKQYCLTLEFVVGILGKTNGKIARLSGANALLDRTFRMLDPEFSDEIFEVAAMHNLDYTSMSLTYFRLVVVQLIESCKGKGQDFIPENAEEVVQGIIAATQPRLEIQFDDVKRAKSFVDLSNDQIMVACYLLLLLVVHSRLCTGNGQW